MVIRNNELYAREQKRTCSIEGQNTQINSQVHNENISLDYQDVSTKGTGFVCLILFACLFVYEIPFLVFQHVFAMVLSLMILLW